jgi:hypothetical protein
MNLGEILDRTFQIYRSRFLVFAGIAALPALGRLALEAANYLWWKLYPDPFGMTVFLWLTPQKLLYLIGLKQVSLLLQILAWPALAYATFKSFTGEQPRLIGSCSRFVVRWRSLLWLAVASWGIVLFLPELIGMGLLVGYYFSSEVLNLGLPQMGIGGLGPRMLFLTVGLACLAFIWLGAGLSMAIPAWAGENLGVKAALRRGWNLSRGSRFRVFAAGMVPTVIGLILSLAVSWVLFLMIAGCFSLGLGDLIIRRAQALFVATSLYGWCVPSSVVEGLRIGSGALISTLLGPIFPIALTLFYYDQRIRLEGFDIERMMETAGLNVPVTPLGEAGTAAAPPPEEELA